MSQIYKLNHTEGDNIKHIYIFAALQMALFYLSFKTPLGVIVR